MGDLIDRQAAIDMKFTQGINDDGVLYVPYGEVKKNIEGLPSAQPEIIRCKDCKYLDSDTHQCRIQICAVFYENDFCSYAERREDG